MSSNIRGAAQTFATSLCTNIHLLDSLNIYINLKDNILDLTAGRVNECDTAEERESKGSLSLNLSYIKKHCGLNPVSHITISLHRTYRTCTVLTLEQTCNDSLLDMLPFKPVWPVRLRWGEERKPCRAWRQFTILTWRPSSSDVTIRVGGSNAVIENDNVVLLCSTAQCFLSETAGFAGSQDHTSVPAHFQCVDISEWVYVFLNVSCNSRKQ